MNEQLELPVQWRTDFISGLVITPAWYGLRQQVKHLAQFGGSAQVVHGPKGSGKTTFLLFLQEDQEWDLFAVDALPKRSFETLLGNILDALDCPRPAGGVGEGLAELRRYVQQLERDQARAVLAVDNADQLEDATIAALMSVLQGSQDMGFGLHWLFVSRPGLAERIDRLQLLDIEVSDVALPNFSPSELQTLLLEAKKHRRLANDVNTEQVQRIWAQASGWPGPALDIAAHAGVAHDKRNSESRRRVWPISHVAALTILLAVLLWAVLVRDRDLSTPNNAQVPGERERQVLSLPSVRESEPAVQGLPAQTVAPDASPAAGGGEASRGEPAGVVAGSANEAQTGGGDVTVEPELRAADNGVETGLNLDRDQDAATDSRGDQAEPMPGSADTDELAAPSMTASDLSGDGVPPEAGPAAAPPPGEGQTEAGTGDEGAAEPAAENASSAPANPDVAEPSAQPRQAESAVLPDGNTDTDGEPSAAATELTAGETHLLALPADSYVLQLMAIGSLAKMQAFVAAQPNSGQLHIYRALRNGKQLYILVEGFYDDRRAAQAGITNLPSAQRRGGPWPKSTGQIQQEIRRLNGL